jgi:hypothetical protein
MAVEELSGIGLKNFMFFMIISIIFLIICYKIPGNLTLTGMFFIATLMTQWALNSAATVNPLVCGKLQIGNAFIYTLIPWILILGVGNLFLYNFSGWIRVFSNTIGMWFSYKFLNSKLNINVAAETTSTDPQFKKIYTEILEQPQTIINEINILDKEEDKIKPLFVNYKKINPEIFKDENQDQIIKIIKYKNKIGILIWNILFGLIASMISTNSLLNSGCTINII